jgi:hypothetical protein
MKNTKTSVGLQGFFAKNADSLRWPNDNGQ